MFKYSTYFTNLAYRSFLCVLIDVFMPIFQEGILPEQFDFCEFRSRVEELIKDIAFICGAKTIFTMMGNFLRQASAQSMWNEMEAALFIMQSISKNLLP